MFSVSGLDLQVEDVEMRRIVFATLVLAVASIGCDGKQLSKKEVEQVAQNAKFKSAIVKQKRQVLTMPPEVDEAQAAGEAAKPETPLVATEVLGAALKSAKAGNKAVLVHFTADW